MRSRLQTGDKTLAPALARLLREAESVIKDAPVAITDKQGTGIEMPSGDPRDYVSISTYYWPVANNPAAPWTKKDGVANKALIERYDTPRLRKAAERVTTSCLAWWFTGDDRFAQAAVGQLQVFFLNKETRMNPHLSYAQFIPNVNGGMGNAHGLIDSRFFVDMLSAVALLETGPHLSPTERDELRGWFRDYLNWLTTSKLGLLEARATNNHSLYYDCQTLAFALYVGDLERADKIVKRFGPERIALQIGPDGRLEKELARPGAATYTCFALEALAEFVAMANQAGLTPAPWSWTSADGRSIPKAFAWAAPYLKGQKWTFGSNHVDTFSQTYLTRVFRIAAQATGDAECLDLAQAFKLPEHDRIRLLVPLIPIQQ